MSDVSFSANAGEFLGLLGPNGAGKTTLLKMLSTLVLPDEGSATIEGLDVVRDAAAVRELVSPCLAMERSLYHRLTARQNLEVFADLQGLRRERTRRAHRRGDAGGVAARHRGRNSSASSPAACCNGC